LICRQYNFFNHIKRYYLGVLTIAIAFRKVITMARGSHCHLLTRVLPHNTARGITYEAARVAHRDTNNKAKLLGVTVMIWYIYEIFLLNRYQ